MIEDTSEIALDDNVVHSDTEQSEWQGVPDVVDRQCPQRMWLEHVDVLPETVWPAHLTVD
jgi:hypothetical protein